MSASPTTTCFTSPRRRSAIARRLLALTFVAIACFGAFRLGRLWADWRQVSQARVVPTEVAAEMERASAVLPLDGHWSFAGSDWDFRSRTVAADQIDRALAAVADSLNHDATPQTSEASRELVDYVRQLNLESEQQNGNQIYRLDRQDLKAVLVVRELGNGKQAAAAAFACRQSEEAWELFELAPRSSASGSLSIETDLLPLPFDATRNGGRFADDGQLLMELVTLGGNTSSASDLLESWNTAGWEIRPSGLADADSFSYLCRRGGEVVYAWSADSSDALNNLMLVRTPAAVDTVP